MSNCRRGNLFEVIESLGELYKTWRRANTIEPCSYPSLTAADLFAGLLKATWFHTLSPESKKIFRSVFIGCIEDPINHETDPFMPIKPEEYEQYILKAVTSVRRNEKRSTGGAGPVTDIILKDLNKQLLTMHHSEQKETYMELFLRPEAAQQMLYRFKWEKGPMSSNSGPPL